MRKYTCDRCGKEVRNQDELNDLLFRWKDAEETFLGEFCGECSDRIEDWVKEGAKIESHIL